VLASDRACQNHINFLFSLTLSFFSATENI
jgi:hypothetical protein